MLLEFKQSQGVGGAPVYLNPDYVVAVMTDGGKGSRIITTAGDPVYVEGDPAAIAERIRTKI